MLTTAAAPRRLTLDLTPCEVASRCRHLPGVVFFDSAADLENSPQLSLIAAAPREMLSGRSEADWERLRVALRKRLVEGAPDDGLPRGFAAGSVDYDGAFQFGIYEDVLIFRHANETWLEVGNLASQLKEWEDNSAPSSPRFVSAMTRGDFCERVQRAKDYIAAGDIYQVNLSQRFDAAWQGDPWKFYEALRHYSPAPHAAYLDQPGRTILSSSPESFLRISGRQVRTRPIKGTRPRRVDPGADERSAYDLLTSAKEIAELVMITDLERNDLGQVCEYGSVRVVELLKLERYEQVFHLVSTVEGTLRSDVDQVDALRSAFPGGSITGAPKCRAREIISELEPVPRGLYTGAIGYFGFNGESQFSIAIRTVVVENDVAHFHVGSGIVADSTPEAEYEETLHKAAGILLAAERMGGG
jgi:aminodeoxychorismate synthase component I